MSMDGGMRSLPEEIITSILKRLPVRDLIRFQLVCKDWNNLIKAPCFINEHLHHSSHQNPNLILEGIVPDKPLRLYMPDREMQFLEVKTLPVLDHWKRLSVIDSSNGLLCISLGECTPIVILWNPAIRQVRLERSSLEGARFNMGFGFSSVVNDYKVVLISAFTNDKLVLLHEVDVFSLSRRSWKKVESGKLLDVAIKSNGKSINGVIFWFGDKLNVKEGVENDGHLLVSYDIVKEEFALIPLPISTPKPTLHDSLRYRLAVHENKLALLSHTTTGDRESSLIDLWVMDEDTGAKVETHSWIKKYKYSIKHQFLLLPATIWRDEIVCHFLRGKPSATEPKVKGFEANIVLAKLSTNEFKRFVIERYDSGYHILNYIESLVPVRHKMDDSTVVDRRLERLLPLYTSSC